MRLKTAVKTKNYRTNLKRKKELAVKPGSVVDSHSSGTPVAKRLMRPTREQCGQHYRSPIWPYSGWGLPCHGMLPPARCALTAPFHPYQPFRTSAVYFLWRFPSARAAQVLPGTLPCGARTFLHSTTRTWAGSGCLANSSDYYTSHSRFVSENLKSVRTPH